MVAMTDDTISTFRSRAPVPAHECLGKAARLWTLRYYLTAQAVAPQHRRELR